MSPPAASPVSREPAEGRDRRRPTPGRPSTTAGAPRLDRPGRRRPRHRGPGRRLRPVRSHRHPRRRGPALRPRGARARRSPIRPGSRGPRWASGWPSSDWPHSAACPSPAWPTGWVGDGCCCSPAASGWPSPRCRRPVPGTGGSWSSSPSGRPFLSAAYAVAQVGAAEETGSAQRASAVALVAAGYAVGAGATAVIYGSTGHALGYRGVFLLALVPMVGLPFVARWVSEPDRFRAGRAVGPSGGGRSSAPWPGPTAAAWLVVDLAGLLTGGDHRAGQQLRLPLLPEREAVPRLRRVGHGASGPGSSGSAASWPGCGWPTGSVADRRPWGPWCASVRAGILCYSGSGPALVVGYLLGITAGGVIAPAAGAFVNELFPTSVRASVAGWNVAGAVLGAVAGLRPVRCHRRRRQPIRPGRPGHLPPGHGPERPGVAPPRDARPRARVVLARPRPPAEAP